jgi:hypothetical protein
MGIVDFSGTSHLSLFLTGYKYTKYLLQFHPPTLLVLHISTPTEGIEDVPIIVNELFRGEYVLIIANQEP